MEKAMNHIIASQLIAERQADLAADLRRRAMVKEARAARKVSVASASAGRPARNRWLFLGWSAHAGA
jgi:hypothetical protein